MCGYAGMSRPRERGLASARRATVPAGGSRAVAVLAWHCPRTCFHVLFSPAGIFECLLLVQLREPTVWIRQMKPTARAARAPAEGRNVGDMYSRTRGFTRPGPKTKPGACGGPSRGVAESPCWLGTPLRRRCGHQELSEQKCPSCEGQRSDRGARGAVAKLEGGKRGR